MKKNLKIFATVSMIFILVLQSGCTKDSSTNPSDSTPGANTVTYVDNLKIPDNNPNITNTRVDSNYITFTIVNGVSPVNTGDILLSTNGDGYLRKVVSTSLTGNTVTVTTENASMEEAIKDAHYDSSFVLQPVEGTLNKALDHNEQINIDGIKGRLIITSGKPLAKLSATNSDWSMTFPNFKYTITDNQNYKFEIVTDAFVISIKNDLSMQTDFTLLTGLEKLSIKNTKSISLEFVNAKIVLNGGKIGSDTKSYPLVPDISFGVFPVLGIPFIASLAIDFGIEYELTANGGFQSTSPIKLTYSDDAGFLYQKNQGLSTSWNPNVSMSGSLTFKPTSGFKGELRAFIKPQLKLKAVGQAGPTFFAKGFEYNKVTFPPLECELGWGLAGGIGAEISLFSKRLFYQELTLAEKRWPFMKKSYANTAPGIPAPTSPLNNATSVSLAPTLSWSCTDPDGDALAYDVYFGTLNPPTTKVGSNQSATTLARSGLSNSTNYYWSVNAIDEYGSSTSSPIWKFTTTAASATPPTVTTTAASGTTSSSATGGGNVTSQGSTSVTARGVCWSTSQSPTTASSKTSDGIGTGSFTSSITGLTASTTYYVRAYATNSAGTSYGSQVSFTTSAGTGTAPTVTTTAITGVTTNAASGGGNVTSQGSASVTARGVCWSTSQNPTTLDSKTSDVSGTGSFTSSITGLSPSTTYYVKAYATNSAGTSYGNQVSFTTSSGIISQGMVQVTGGTFTAGSTSVTISSFKMDKYEVTYELWIDVQTWALANGYTDLVAGQNGYNPNGTNNPVTVVNWYDIVKWCNARSEKDGLTPVYYTSSSFIAANVYKTGETNIDNTMVSWTANGYRLPTETEWEFAAKGGTLAQSTPYVYSGSNTIDDVAWYSSNSGTTTHTVGTKSANELGIYDMSGNVWEWCWDWSGSTYPSGGTTDPKGPSTTQTFRLLRGGSFDFDEGLCRVDYRDYSYPDGRSYGVGFRCVQD